MKTHAMRFVDDFRDPDLIRNTLREIHRLADGTRHFRIMEVCGGHTHAIYRFGLADLLPKNLELIHGPGCPVCVLPMGRMDEGLALANRKDVIFTAYGDMMRVPGSHGSPLESKARGADVRIVYSPMDALKIARAHPDRQVVFFAIGFETTAPSTAVTIRQAASLGVQNFAVFCNHITILPAITALLDSPDISLDAFLGPGHVSTVIGCQPYEVVASTYGRPIAIVGFEPLDILQGLVMVLRQLRQGIAKVENQYERVVPWNGNPTALRLLEEVFEIRPHFEWRGLGSIPQSALRIREKYGAWDAERTMSVPAVTIADPNGARCGEVLRGVMKPHECELFGSACTPERPVGALMVSSEGACAAHYKYALHTIQS